MKGKFSYGLRDPYLPVDPVLPEWFLIAKSARQAKIREYIGIVRHRLNLLDWEVRYNPNSKPDPEHSAEITYSESDRAAVIVVSEFTDDLDLEAVITHELLHAALKPLVDQAERLLVHVDGDRARVHIHEMFDDAEEQVIEVLTRALVMSAPRVAVPHDGKHDLWEPFAR